MKALRIFIVLVFIIGICLASAKIAGAEEKQGLNPSVSLKDNLVSNTGKRVSIMISSGQSVEGIIEKVGDHFVHIAKLSGKEFYDAVVRIDRIDAVIFKAR